MQCDTIRKPDTSTELQVQVKHSERLKQDVPQDLAPR